MVAAFLVSLGLGFFVLRKRKVPGAFPLSLMIFAVSEWTFCYIFEVFSLEFSTKIFWLKLEYFGITFTPVFWLFFAFDYTNNKKHISAINFLYLSIIPLLTILLAFTNDSHHLVWRLIILKNTNGMFLLELSYGMWLWLHALYSYGLLIFGSLLIVRSIIKFQTVFKHQARLIILSIAFSSIGNILYVCKLTPIPNFDYTPFTIIISVAIIVYAIFRYHLFNIVPLAQKTLIENMHDGVIFIDNNDRIMDCNPTAKKIFSLTKQYRYGIKAHKVLPDWILSPEIIDSKKNSVKEVVTRKNNVEFIYDIEISTLTDEKNNPKGKLLVLHNVTEQKKTQKSLVESEKSMRTLYENIAGGILLINENYIIEDVNERTCEISGYTRKELIGKLCDIVCPQGSASNACPIWEQGNDGFQGMDTAIKCKDGSKNPIIKNSKMISLHGKRFIFENFQDTLKQKQAEEQLKKELHEKKILLQEIHHRVKNNMQVMIGLLHLQSQSFDDDRIKEMFKIASNRIFSMASVHEDLYKTDTYSDVDIHSYLKKLVPGVVNSFDSDKDIEIFTDAKDIAMNIDKAVPCGLIINELISNSMKYAFLGRNNGKISVIIKQNNEHFFVEVLDNGVGLPKNFDCTNSKGFGLELTSILGEKQLGGTISLTNDGGASFKLTFPKVLS